MGLTVALLQPDAHSVWDERRNDLSRAAICLHAGTIQKNMKYPGGKHPSPDPGVEGSHATCLSYKNLEVIHTVAKTESCGVTQDKPGGVTDPWPQAGHWVHAIQGLPMGEPTPHLRKGAGGTAAGAPGCSPWLTVASSSPHSRFWGLKATHLPPGPLGKLDRGGMQPTAPKMKDEKQSKISIGGWVLRCHHICLASALGQVLGWVRSRIRGTGQREEADSQTAARTNITGA